MAVQFPYLPLYVQDLISDPKVAAMSNECLGAYVRLLCYCWIDGYLPVDEKKLKVMSRLGRRWGHHRDDLMHRFVQQKLELPVQQKTELGVQQITTVLTHPRLDAERAKLLERRALGRSAAAKRWGGVVDADAYPSASRPHMRGACSSSSVSSSSSPHPTPTEPAAVGLEELEKEEQRMMQRYTRDLSVEEMAVTKEVLEFINTDLRKRKPYGAQHRVNNLYRLEKYPSVQIGKACHDFKKGEFIQSGKRLNYLLGIVRKSAAIWYQEWVAEKNKRRFDLE